MNFNVNWPAFVFDSLPVINRIGKYMDYCLACLSQFIVLHTAFLVYNNQKRIEAGLTSSRLALEKYLRDTFNVGINVINQTKIASVFIYREAQALTEPTMYREADNRTIPTIYREANADGELEYSFIVEVPTAVIDLSDFIKVAVNKIKPVGTNYNIIEI